jgi:hypothetical protein
VPKRVTKKFHAKFWVGFIRMRINSSRELLLTEQLISSSVKVGGGEVLWKGMRLPVLK